MKRLLLVLVLTSFAFTISPVHAMNNDKQENNQQLTLIDNNAPQNITGNTLTIKVNDKAYILPQDLIIKILSFLFGGPSSQQAPNNSISVSLVDMPAINQTGKYFLSTVESMLKDEKFLASATNDIFYEASIHNFIPPINIIINTPELLKKITTSNLNETISLLCKKENVGILKLIIKNSQLLNKFMSPDNEEHVNQILKEVISSAYENERGEIFKLIIKNSQLLNKFMSSDEEEQINEIINITFNYACHSGRIEIAQDIIETPELLKALDDETINDVVCSNYNKIKELIGNSPELFDKLIDHNKNTIINRKNNKAFVDACSNGDFDKLQRILDDPKALKKLTKKKITKGFFAACQPGIIYEKILQLLLAAGLWP